MQLDDTEILEHKYKLQALIDQHDYWKGHAVYTIEDWKFEVKCNDTLMSYWDWVLVMIEEKEWEVRTIDKLVKEGRIEENPDGSFRSVPERRS